MASTHLKNMKVSWDDYSQYMENKKCSKPPASNSFRYHPIHHWSGSPTDSGTPAPVPAAAAACAAVPSNLNDGRRLTGQRGARQGKGKRENLWCLVNVWKNMKIWKVYGKFWWESLKLCEKHMENPRPVKKVYGESVERNVNHAKCVRKPKQIYEMINGSSRSWEVIHGWAGVFFENLSEDKTRTMD